MSELSRRDLLGLGLLAATGLGFEEPPADDDLQQQLLDLAARFERERRARFAAIRTGEQLSAIQDSLRKTFRKLLGGLPERIGAPPSRELGRIDGGDYSVDKLVFESFPGYFVPALLYLPKERKGPLPGVLSPCGHSTNGKAAEPYQTLHDNLARKGFAILTYDPVGQGERSQFWDEGGHKSRFNLSCGEHAVIGNALELLGTNFARYRIHDGLRALDYLASRPEVDPNRLGCVGNSGGGNLTAYLAALEPRIAAAAPCCYITTLPRRMANRIQEDPSSDPEQDIPGFVSEGIDHAGLLALCAPRPTLIGTATLDFFPIEGARESFAEARKLYAISDAADRVAMVESQGKHGLSRTLREAVYAWFGRWLAGRQDPEFARELPFKPRPDAEIQVCERGQVGLSLRSRPLLPLAFEEFQRRPRSPRRPLGELLGVDPGQARPKFSIVGPERAVADVLIVCVNGNEAPDWGKEIGFARALSAAGVRLAIVEPRGVGPRRVGLEVKGHDYTDPISGVEANLAYNAFLVGRNLLGLRVSDVLAAIKSLRSSSGAKRLVLCGSGDAALVAVLAAALDQSVDRVAVEGLLMSFKPLFSAEGHPLNAASIVPGLLRDFGDIPDVLDQIRPRQILVAEPRLPEGANLPPFIHRARSAFRSDPRVLTEWVKG